jgi:hypothetical protein
MFTLQTPDELKLFAERCGANRIRLRSWVLAASVQATRRGPQSIAGIIRYGMGVTQNMSSALILAPVPPPLLVAVLHVQLRRRQWIWQLWP